MSKKGFTLVELLAVLVLLSVIVLVAFPSILGAFKSTDSKVNENTKELLKANARTYVNENPSIQTSTGCITVKKLIDEGYTQTPLANVNEDVAKKIEDSWSIGYKCNDGICKEFNVFENESCK